MRKYSIIGYGSGHQGQLRASGGNHQSIVLTVRSLGVRVYLKDSGGVRCRTQIRVTITDLLNPKRNKIPFQTRTKQDSKYITPEYNERQSHTKQKGKPEG